MKKRVLAYLFVIGTAINPMRAEVWTYPSPAEEYQSPVYEVKITQESNSSQSFVYANKNTFTERLKQMTDFNHWTCFSFDGTITIEVTKLNGNFSEVLVYPLSRGIKPTVSGNTLQFTIDKPEKLYIKEPGDYDNPLFVFADAPEQNIPDKKAPNVLVIEPGKDSTAIRNLVTKNPNKDIYYFEGGGVHKIGLQFPMLEGKSYYLAGGSYLIGTFYGDSVSNVTIYGRGILSGIEYPRMPGPQSIPFNMVMFYGEKTKQKVEGITITNPPHFHILSRGAIHVDNVKLFSWWVQTDGFGGGENSMIENSFMKVMDDFVKIYKSNTIARNLIFYHQLNGSLIQLGWGPSKGHAKNALVENIEVIACEASNKNRALLGFEENNGATVSNFTIRNITCDQGLYRLIGIYQNKGGCVKNIRFENISINGPLSATSDFEAGQGMIKNITFKNISIDNKVITDVSELKIHTTGKVEQISIVE